MKFDNESRVWKLNLELDKLLFGTRWLGSLISNWMKFWVWTRWLENLMSSRTNFYCELNSLKFDVKYLDELGFWTRRIGSWIVELYVFGESSVWKLYFKSDELWRWIKALEYDPHCRAFETLFTLLDEEYGETLGRSIGIFARNWSLL